MARGLPKGEKKARESRLQQAIELDDVDLLHNLIVEEPELLDRVSKPPFPNTPLHVAVAAGKMEVAMEMVILKPSFARKLNSEGYSPMHRALQHEHYNIVRALMTRDPKLVRVLGRCGITPLHYVAGKEGDDELELLTEFLCICKSSIEDLTNQCETAVHVALKNHNLKAFEVLFRWLERANLTQILDWKDKDGNSALHIAANVGQPKIIKLLSQWTDVQAKNSLGETALEIFQVNSRNDQDVVERLRPPRLLPRSFYAPLSLPQLITKLIFHDMLGHTFYIQDESARNVILVVSTLMATATYQAALSPPGGYWQDSSSNSPTYSTVVTANSTEIANGKPHQAGKMILSGSRLYVFTLLNSMAFLISICIILAAAVPLLPDTATTCLSMFILAANYFLSLAMGFQNSSDVGLNLIGGFFMVAMYFFFGLSAFIQEKHFQVRRQINATRRRVGNF